METRFSHRRSSPAWHSAQAPQPVNSVMATRAPSQSRARVARGHDPPDGLVSEHEWKLWGVGQAGKDMQVRAADTTGLDLDDDLVAGRNGLRQLDLLEPVGRQRDDRGGSHAAGSAGGCP